MGLAAAAGFGVAGVLVLADDGIGYGPLTQLDTALLSILLYRTGGNSRVMSDRRIGPSGGGSQLQHVLPLDRHLQRQAQLRVVQVAAQQLAGAVEPVDQ